VAKQILEKYAPEQLVTKTTNFPKILPVPSLTPRSSSSPSSPVHNSRAVVPTGTPAAASGHANTDLRRRLNATGAAADTPVNRLGAANGARNANVSFAAGGGNAVANRRMNESLVMAGGTGPQTGMRGPAPGPPLPRPVMPRERGYMDRMVEYLVGDGPANRYALICKQCQSHNGMALREEFEYIAYRCCYCHYWNPARKERPVAPRLPQQMAQLGTLQRQSSTESTSDEDEAPAKPAASITLSSSSAASKASTAEAKKPEIKREESPPSKMEVDEQEITTASESEKDK